MLCDVVCGRVTLTSDYSEMYGSDGGVPRQHMQYYTGGNSDSDGDYDDYDDDGYGNLTDPDLSDSHW